MKKSAEKRDEIKTIAVASCIAASVAVAPSPLPGNPEPSPPAPLVDFEKVPHHILKKLLANKSIRDGREHPITFGTDAYADKIDGRDALSPITAKFLSRKPYAVRARVEKSRETQTKRTKSRAEVFTPSWLCKKMVDFLDGEILATKNTKDTKNFSRVERAERVEFDWRKYVDVRVLEITCGEAPFIVSRYDATTGEPIPVENRIGVLDRKLRMVNENAADEAEWMKWSVRAYESVYGYEYQGDSLAIARYNLLATFEDNLRERWGRKAKASELEKIANRIAWNFWQMDGLTGTTWKERDLPVQGELFSATKNTEDTKNLSFECFIFDWRARKPVKYNDIGRAVVFATKTTKTTKKSFKGATTMKFDYAIGNPPYQEETQDTSDKPIYNIFMDGAYDVSDKVELITPARFLFNAGKTPKAWNEKMLADPHLKVLEYTQRSGEVFANTDIKGGVAITYRDATKECGAIQSFSAFEELNSILHKVLNRPGFATIMEMIVQQNKWNLELVLEEHPEIMDAIGSGGTERRLTTPIFNLAIFRESKQSGDVKILGLVRNRRHYRYIERKYIQDNGNLEYYKVILPASNGSGAIGEVLSTPLCGTPLCGYTQSFIAIGTFENKDEAENCLKYIKTKFARTMLGILKVTQHNHKDTWRYVPLQDFTSASDIDWSKSIKEIDRQLYRKYKLTKKEIDFIEEKVKEME